LLSHRPQEFLDDGHGNVKGIKMVIVRWEKIDGQMRHSHRRNLTQREVGKFDLAVGSLKMSKACRYSQQHGDIQRGGDFPQPWGFRMKEDIKLPPLGF
jgi:hypothetical protein